MDIVEIEGRAIAKRGKMSGAKQVWRDEAVLRDRLMALGKEPETLGLTPQLVPLMEDGELIDELPTPDEIRARVLDQLRIAGKEIEAIGPAQW